MKDYFSIATFLALASLSRTASAALRGSENGLLNLKDPSSSNRHLFEFSNPDCSSAEYDLNPYYVSPNGNNWNIQNGWGLSIDKPFQTIQHAINKREPCQTIYVTEGTYRNDYFGQSLNHKNKIVNLNGVNDLKLLGHSNGDESSKPVLEFDGPGAIIGGSAANPISNIEIAGFEIRGPNESITYEDAMTSRLYKRTYYNGRGIAIWGGHHIYIHDLEVHHCPASGIRVNKGDYVTISNNKVYSNTWWSSSAESAVVLAESKHIDDSEIIKMRLSHNIVYDNVNKIPYYNPNYSWDYSPIGNNDCGTFPACEQELVEGCPWECRYGKKTQDYIVDGMGVYVTRNSNTYLHGRMELAFNTCYKNGINGVVFHRTDRGIVRHNTVYDNGIVPRLDKPETNVEDWHNGCKGKSRQPYSGITINNAKSVKLWSNNVSARYDDDYAFKQEVDGSGSPHPLSAGGNNKVCRGLVDPNLASVIKEVDDLTICGIDYVEVFCGNACHLIQWPYNMHDSYDDNSGNASEQCRSSCDAQDCKAFSIQDDYRPGEEGMKFCFLYKESEEPSANCADDPFNQGDCSYTTSNGQFFVAPSAKERYNVQNFGS